VNQAEGERTYHCFYGVAKAKGSSCLPKGIDVALDKLEAFTSLNGPAFYGLQPHESTITLRREPPDYPAQIETGAGPVILFDPEFPLAWRVV
ncbi:MAG: hypothetical protein AAFZ02_12215, partial [Pseudomonadota bacterium]